MRQIIKAIERQLHAAKFFQEHETIRRLETLLIIARKATEGT